MMGVKEAESVTDRRRKRRKHPWIFPELSTTGKSTVVLARERQNDATEGNNDVCLYGYLMQPLTLLFPRLMHSQGRINDSCRETTKIT